ncbi:MAG: hypothetical protein IKP74_01730, partial [Clostridia bacterium]|nr:hypothetical protein [Clostridia bacterium]
MKRIVSLCLLLCVVFSVFALASCGGKVPDETTAAPETEATGADGTDGETVAVTTDKWEALAPQIARLAERDRTLKIECSEFKTAEKASKNDIYLKGPDE